LVNSNHITGKWLLLADFTVRMLKCVRSGSLQVWAIGSYMWNMFDACHKLPVCLVWWPVYNWIFLSVGWDTHSWRRMPWPADIVSKCLFITFL